MHWLKTNLKSSFMAILGTAGGQAAALDDRLEEIRELMVDELGDFGERHFPKIVRRVRYASDAHGLWYARGDVMAVLATVHGETLARQKMQGISDKFSGILPRGLASRPSPLTTTRVV